MTDTQMTMIVTTVGIIANQFFQHWRTEQALKERALELKEATAKLAEEVQKTTAVTAFKTHAKLDTLKDLQVDNTRITEGVGVKADAAYKEANDVNAKILSLKQNGEKLERIDSVTSDTNAVVREIQKETKP